MASAISSAGGPFRPLPATCDASTPRFGDGRSMDERGLRLFPLPGPDAVFPIPQDAPLWTYWGSPESGRGVGLWPAALARSGADPQFVTLARGHGCAWLPVKRKP
jgi:hypothetical protein